MKLLGPGMCALALTATATPSQAQITLAAGDIALIGWVDNTTPDQLTLVTLAAVPAGSILYFTDNGWSSTGNAFRNTLGPSDGDGNEQLLKLTANVALAAGRIISSNDVSADFTFVTSGAIPGVGVTSGTFAFPALATAGDQLAVFQHDTGDNPLNTPVHQHVYVLDDTGAFEDATTSNTGDVPPGLVLGTTAVTFQQNATGQNFMAFNTATLSSGTKAQWLAAIADPNNWTFATAGTLPSGTILVTGGTGVGFCPGDGSGTACPCANHSPLGSGEGCLNSLGVGGRVVATGTPSLAADSVLLIGAGMPNSSALYFQGTTRQAGGAGAVFGDGLRCAGGAIVRLKTLVNSGGGSSYPGVGDPRVSTRGLVLVPGTRTYQIWYRNAAVFCTPSTFNLSSGWEITWLP